MKRVKNSNEYMISAKNKKIGGKKTVFSFNFRKFVFVGILSFALIRTVYREYQFCLVDKYGIEVKAVVYKATQRENFSRYANYYVYYEFPVKKRWYKKKAGMFHNEFSKGDSIKVKYLPEEPDINFIKERIDNSISGLIKKIVRRFKD